MLAALRSRSRLAVIVRRYLRERRGALALAALALGGVVLTDLIAPWPLKIILDHVLLAKPLPSSLAALQPLLDLGAWPALLACAASIALIALLGGSFSYLQLYTTARIGHGISLHVRGELFAHLQRLSLAYHQRSRGGELLSKVASDTNLLRDMFADWMLSFVAHVATVVAMLGVMFWVNWQLALVVATTLPPLFAVLHVLNRRVRLSAREQRHHEGRMASRLNEVLSSIALVQAFGRGDHEEGRFRAEIEHNYESGVRNARTTAAITKAIATISAVGTAVTVLVGAQQVLAGRLTPGELLIFITYVGNLYKPVRDIGRLVAKFSRAGASAQRVGEILDSEPEIEDAPDALELAQPAGEIVFEDVSFAYPGSAKPVLDRVNLRIAAGERVALVGPSGAGKSTVLSLLLRLYEPTGGRIRVDGIDIRRYRRDSLRREIGVVLQDTVLFAASVRDNIAYGCPQASAAAVQRAAQDARAHEFIVDLPEGYDTEVGERGAGLSGGQRQRLCLARALVKQPAMLVMDEPTSQVDAASARLIHEAVARAHRGRTLLVISHQYADLAAYDRVLVLKDGRIAECGHHDELLRGRGAYLSRVERAGG